MIIMAYKQGEMKGNESIEKYWDRVRELKMLWSMKGMARPVIVGTLGRIHKGLERNRRNKKSEKEPRPWKPQYS